MNDHEGWTVTYKKTIFFVNIYITSKVTGQLVDMPTCRLPTHGLVSSRTGQLTLTS